MTDIKQAIAELREAINCGDNLKIGGAFRNLQFVTHETFPAIRLLGEIDLELFYFKPRRVEKVWPIIDRLESSVEGGTVDLTARIEAAAEEIKKAFNTWEASVLTVAATRRKVSMNDEEVCNVIKGLLNKLYEVANKYNDRSCDEDVCHEVRNARIMLGRLGIYQYRMYADYDYLEVK